MPWIVQIHSMIVIDNIILLCVFHYRIVKPKVMKELKSYQQVANLDLSGEQKIFVKLGQMNVGSEAERMLKDGDLTEADKLPLFSGFKKFVLGMVKKIMERSPLKRRVVRSLGWLQPQKFLSKEGW